MNPPNQDTHPVRTRSLWTYCWALLTAVAVVGCAGTAPSGDNEMTRRSVQTGLHRYPTAPGTAPAAR